MMIKTTDHSIPFQLNIDAVNSPAQSSACPHIGWALAYLENASRSSSGQLLATRFDYKSVWNVAAGDSEINPIIHLNQKRDILKLYEN